MASSPPRKTCAPFGPLPGSFVCASTDGGVSRVVHLQAAVRIQPRATAQMRRSRFAVITSSDRDLALRAPRSWSAARPPWRAWPLVGVHVARIALDERQERAVAIGRVAVGHAVAVEPVHVLVDDGLAQLRAGTPRSSAGGAPNSARSMTCAIRRLPSAFRCTPLIVSGAFASPHRASRSARTGRRTRRRCALRDVRHRPRVEREARRCSPCRPGKSGLCRSSCAMGENSTMRGADLPLYFCASVCAIQSPSSLLELRRAPPAPA